MKKIISVEFKADFGFFKKPDINDTIFLTYNFIHKPAVLGIFGAILGLEGHKKEGELPEYYQKLKDLKIGIEPIGHHKKGNFEKILVKYNDATGISGGGATLNVLEQVLVKPAYRIYIKINGYSDDELKFANDEEKKEFKNLLSELKERLKNNKAIFIPYFGKNEFHCWWEKFNDKYQIKELSDEFKITTIFSKPEGKTLKDLKKQIAFNFSFALKNPIEKIYATFERLPVGFDEDLHQYSELQEFVYTNMIFHKNKFSINGSQNFKEIKKNGEERGKVIYLF